MGGDAPAILLILLIFALRLRRAPAPSRAIAGILHVHPLEYLQDSLLVLAVDLAPLELRLDLLLVEALGTLRAVGRGGVLGVSPRRALQRVRG